MLRDRTRRKVITHRLAMGRPGNKNGTGKERAPSRLDHFEITTNSPDANGQFPVDREAMARLDKADVLGRKYDTQKPRRLPIRVDSDNIEDFMVQRYECRIPKEGGGTEVFCHGDGATAHRLVGRGVRKEIRCCARPQFGDGKGYPDRTPKELDDILSRRVRHNPEDGLRCPFAQNTNAKEGPTCEPVTELVVRCDVATGVGARARFRSHGHRTADQVYGSLLDIKEMMPGGMLQNIPLDLCMQMVRLGDSGYLQPVAHIELRISPDRAAELASAHAQKRAHLEGQVSEARRLLAEARVQLDEDAEENAAEFHDPEAPSGAFTAEVIDVEVEPATAGDGSEGGDGEADG